MVKRNSIFTFLFFCFLAHGHLAYAFKDCPKQELQGLMSLAIGFFTEWPEFMSGNKGSFNSLDPDDKKLFTEYDPFFAKEKLESLFEEFNLRASNEKDRMAGKGASDVVRKVRVKAKDEVYVIGDIHGSAHSLLRNFLRWNQKGILKDDFTLNKTECGGTRKVCFTGDYVDRGNYGIEVWYLLLRLKLANWDSVFLCRGNHEDESMIKAYGFQSEIFMKYEKDDAENLLKTFIIPAFKLLPLALLVGNGEGFIIVTHGMMPLDKDGKPVTNLYNKVLRESQNCLRISRGDLSEVSKETIKEYCCWGDLSKYSGKNTRGLDIENATIESLEEAFKNYVIHAVFRGHQHENNVIGVGTSLCMNDQVTISVSGYSAYTFMSCPEGLGPQISTEGFGCLKIGEKYEDWKLTCFEYSVAPLWRGRGNGSSVTLQIDMPKYAYVSRLKKDGTFLWEKGEEE